MHRNRLMMREESSFSPVERAKSSCARAVTGYVGQLSHPSTCLVRGIHWVARTRWPLAATKPQHYLELTPKLRNIRLTVGVILAVRLFVFQLLLRNGTQH